MRKLEIFLKGRYNICILVMYVYVHINHLFKKKKKKNSYMFLSFTKRFCPAMILYSLNLAGFKYNDMIEGWFILYFKRKRIQSEFDVITFVVNDSRKLKCVPFVDVEPLSHSLSLSREVWTGLYTIHVYRDGHTLRGHFSIGTIGPRESVLCSQQSSDVIRVRECVKSMGMC